MTLKTLNVADTNLLSGSSELIRQALMGYFVNEESGFRDQEVEVNSIITQIGSAPDTIRKVDTFSLINSIKFASRLYGSSDEQNIRSDEEWKRYVIGGTFGTTTYPGIYDDNIYFDHRVRIGLPLYQDEIVNSSDTISGYSRAEYYKRYERYQANLNFIESEHLIPNYYFLFSPDTNGSDIEMFVNLEGSLGTDEAETIFSYIDNGNASVPRYEYSNISQYLNVDYTNHSYTDELKETLQNKLQNIIFLDAEETTLDEANSDSIQSSFASFDNDIVNKVFSLMPMSNHIYFDTDYSNARNSIGVLIIQNDYRPLFLKTLKEAFTGEIDLKPTMVDFALDNRNSKSTSTNALNVIDLPQMLIYNLRNLDSQTNNCVFFNDDSEVVRATFDTDGTYRFVNSEIITNTLNDVVGFMNNRFGTMKRESLEDFLNYCLEGQKYHETLAYRIQKIGGPPTGDSRTENTLQNFWFFNTADAIQYIDTQVRYDTDYTYKIFSYVAIQGFKYRLSDLLLTRQIATAVAQEEDRPTEHCLEFYDPLTNETTANLFEPDSVILENSLASNAQVKTDRRYLSDLNLSIEPSLKIVEVPIQEKTFRIVDNPPNDLIATPMQPKDQSQTLMFFLSYDTFSPDTVMYPTTLTTEDVENKENYLQGNDLLADDHIQYESVSRPVTFEVYRLEQKPSSYQDFENNLRKSINLVILDQDRVKLDATFIERVGANKKYYYTFRVVNENGVAGEFTPIFESELINDGGYIYAEFNQLTAEELIEDQISQPLMSFKKLFNVVPNIQHLILNSQDVDFTDSAFNQVENFGLGAANDKIWGKTFKIRLTSNKTGKKIDLNIKFNKMQG
jgi:hypothetical protein